MKLKSSRKTLIQNLENYCRNTRPTPNAWHVLYIWWFILGYTKYKYESFFYCFSINCHFIAVFLSPVFLHSIPSQVLNFVPSDHRLPFSWCNISMSFHDNHADDDDASWRWWISLRFFSFISSFLPSYCCFVQSVT